MEGTHDDALREALVNSLLAEGHITQPRVAEAFRAMPRHLFLPGMDLAVVYQDEAIAIKEANGTWLSSSSQPAIMAIMLEQLELQPGQRVLEVGAGSGFNAALMAHLVGDAALVTTLDIDDDLVEQARANLAVAGCGDVSVVCTDGWGGYRRHAPYDRVILTVGAWDISPAWVEQLREGGILLLPLDLYGMQLSVAFEKRHGVLRSRSVRCCGFMRLRGEHAGPQVTVPLDESGKALVWATNAGRLNLERLRALLADRPQIDQWSFPGDWLSHFSFNLWLSWNGASIIRLQLNEPAFGLDAGGYEGIYDEEETASLCLVGQTEEGVGPRYAYGSPSARDRLQAMAAGWQAKGSPDPRTLYVIAYPIEATVKPVEGERLLRKRWWQYMVRW